MDSKTIHEISLSHLDVEDSDRQALQVEVENVDRLVDDGFMLRPEDKEEGHDPTGSF